jgi:hypothetical protein
MMPIQERIRVIDDEVQRLRHGACSGHKIDRRERWVKLEALEWASEMLHIVCDEHRPGDDSHWQEVYDDE